MPAWQRRSSVKNWRTSSFTGSTQNCVEIANGQRSVLVRDSHNRSGAMLSFAPGQWSVFLRRVRDGS